MRKIVELLGRWYIALAAAGVLAVAVLLLGLGSFGLWEPQERQLADRAAPREELVKPTAAAPPMALPIPAIAAQPAETCLHQAPKDAVARSLTTRATAWGRDVSDSDAGRRLPFAVLGLLAVLASCGIAMRTAGPRAGVIAALILLSMPLLVLQARQLTTEIGTASGGALIVYGLLALAGRGGVLGIVESVVALASLAGGVAIAFAAGGALLGLLVPIGAYAVAGGLGAPAIGTIARAIRAGAIRIAGAIKPRWAVGRDTKIDAGDTPLADQLKALIATLAAFAVIGVLAYQLYELREPQPGAIPQQRALLGKAIVGDPCWSSALGGIWRVDDDLRFIWDSAFEQIAYGTFPWGLLAPIAFMALLVSPDRGRRRLGAITLAWAGAAWIATEVFQRKVGFTLYSGFPAMAIAIGAWLDAMLGEREPQPTGTRLVAVYFVLGVLVLGKDLQSFSDRLTSLLVGNDAITYPTMAHLAWIPLKLWLLVLGLFVAVALALTVVRLQLRYALGAMLGGTVVVIAFWAFAWQPVLAEHLSSKAMFDTYLDLRKPGDALVLMGDLGDAPHDYAPDAKPEVVTTRDQIVAALGRPNRVFAIAPNTERCQLHRELGGKPYYVVDDRNVRSLLLSNRVDGTTDKNPLRQMILHEPPRDVKYKPKARIVFDNKIELLGWDIPKSAGRGSKFNVKLYYKVLAPVGATWTTFMHFDGAAGRAGNGDHPPINNVCQTSTWQAGDYIVDSYTVPGLSSTYPTGRYDVWTGFFTGSNPNWRNMPVSEAPGDMRDGADRVKITTIDLD